MEKFKHITNKLGIARVYFITVLLLLSVFIVDMVIIDGLHKKFDVNGHVYRYDSVKNMVWTFNDMSGNRVTVSSDYLQYRLEKTTSITLKYKNDIVKREIDFKTFKENIYKNDNLVYSGDLMPVSIRVGDQILSDTSNKSIVHEKRLFDGILVVADYVQSGQLYMEVIFGCFFLLMGSAQIFFPLFFWSLKHMFDVKGGEPTDFYLAMSKVGGVFLILLAYLHPLFIS